ncbi:oligosaccharide flippase family protein [Adhaeribacter rhizoryzae]|uniref:Oligosaccharide flippase family protein n=1 Tax=Adhaeribacter rhizoryzae TaxID=2607907 RepID=A0A5M6CWC3_9BACT|nr:oligosaccharide flippase family protein [Adhaeribacter rhizoryzae]KAA5539256.1 oligosaccharide flippase family protein [Adhaeribacter rhizoryzae]
MLSFLKSSFWSLLSVGSRTVSALIINKIIAGQFGPQGITLLSHFQNLVTLATTIPIEGINVGLVTYLAGKEPNSTNYRRYYMAGIFWQVLVFFVVTGIILSQQHFYLGTFLQQVNPVSWGIFFFLGLVFFLVTAYLQTLMLARQELRAYTILIFVSSVCSALFIWLFLREIPLASILLLYLASQGVTAVVALIIAARKGWLPAWTWEGLNKPILRDIGKFILMALTLAICSKLVNFYVRDLMIKRFDLYQTGLWQAMVKLSDNYTMLFTSLISMVYYPRVAALVQQPEALRRYVRQVFFILVPAIAAGLLLFYGLQRWFIILLFNPDFLPGAYLLDYQVLGDFFKMSAWILSYLMMAQARTGLYILVQVVAAGLYLLILFWLVNKYGLPGVTMAHCVSFGLFLVFNLIFFRKLIF